MIVTIPSIPVTTPDFVGLFARTPFGAARGSHRAPGRAEIAGTAVTVALIVVMAAIAAAWTAGVARTPWRPVKGRHHARRPARQPAAPAQPVSLDAARARLRPVTVITGRDRIAAEVAACYSCQDTASS